MYKFYFYVPESHLKTVKEAIFAAGAGKIGAYDCCCWQILGEGQYRPLAGSKPFKGTEAEVEQTVEYKVEAVCADEHIKAVIAALKLAHPYEEPAYGVWRLEEW